MQQSDVEKLRYLAESAYPEEFCAVLVGRQVGPCSTVTQVLPCPNEHPEPRRAYSIAPEALLQAQRESRREGLGILGFVHSHADHAAEPSPSDSEQAYWPGHVYGILSVCQGHWVEERFYRLMPDGAATSRFEEVALSISARE